MKIRNKTTGEITDLATAEKTMPGPIAKTVSKGMQQKKKFTLKDFTEQNAKSEKRIIERGSFKSELTEAEQKGKMATTLAYMGAPFNAIESAISNPALLMQQGNFSPKELLKEAVLGATLEKQGQYGDVWKNVGVEKNTADAAGLFLNIALPGKVLAMVSNSFSKVAKMTDKGLIKSGKHLVKSAEEGVKFMGNKVGNAFASKYGKTGQVADDVTVNGMDFVEQVVKLPDGVVKASEKVFGNIDDFSTNLTVNKIRQYKRWLGKLKSGSFGKDLRGHVEKLDDADIDKAYSGMKKLMETSLKNNINETTAKMLMKLEKSYSGVVKASNFVKKTVVDPTILQATKAGKAAVKLHDPYDITMRTSMNTLRSSGKLAKKAMDNGIKALNSFNRFQTMLSVGAKTAGAMAFGGAAGAVGGKALHKATGD